MTSPDCAATGVTPPRASVGADRPWHDVEQAAAGQGRPELLAVLHGYAKRARRAFADNTWRAIASDLRQFEAFCLEHRQVSLPATPAALEAWLQDCSCRGLAVATVRRRMASIAHVHRGAGCPDPTDDEAVQLALRCYRRDHGTRQRQAAALDEIGVAIVTAVMRQDTLLELRDRAMLLALRDLLGRRSELVALDTADFTANADGSATVLLRRSKSDQEGVGSVGWLSPSAYRAVAAWWESAGIHQGPAFRSMRRGGHVSPKRLSAADVARRLKAMAARAGLDPSGISGHSPRVGMAQDLLTAGFSLPEIMQAGRWRNPAMVARYTERLRATRGAVARYHDRCKGASR